MSNEHRKNAPVAWQGWLLQLPPKWSPVKLEGDYDEGHALFADLLRPRLGLRWQKQKSGKFHPDDWADKTLIAEVGKLAADEAKALAMPGDNWQASKLYTEPEPPGRDVWLGFSTVSQRAVQVTYHAHRRERIFSDSILPSLTDQAPDRPMAWSVFDLNCIVPAGWTLVKPRLNAGDLGLSFVHQRDRLTLRQIAVAGLALQRMPLDQWLLDQQRMERKHYRASGPVSDAKIQIGPRMLEVRQARLERRKRFCFMRSLAPAQVTFATHDKDRDRLVIAQGSDEAVVKGVVRTIGNAGPVTATPASPL